MAHTKAHFRPSPNFTGISRGLPNVKSLPFWVVVKFGIKAIKRASTILAATGLALSIHVIPGWAENKGPIPSFVEQTECSRVCDASWSGIAVGYFPDDPHYMFFAGWREELPPPLRLHVGQLDCLYAVRTEDREFGLDDNWRKVRVLLNQLLLSFNQRVPGWGAFSGCQHFHGRIGIHVERWRSSSIDNDGTNSSGFKPLGNAVARFADFLCRTASCAIDPQQAHPRSAIFIGQSLISFDGLLGRLLRQIHGTAKPVYIVDDATNLLVCMFRTLHHQAILKDRDGSIEQGAHRNQYAGNNERLVMNSGLFPTLKKFHWLLSVLALGGLAHSSRSLA